MDHLGFPVEFIAMIKLLFVDASASVKVNGNVSPAFVIERGMQQGCPLAPYLFFIVAEVLNASVKQAEGIGLVKGIQLPIDGKQQTLTQYVDDTSFTL
jgi:hypothetical protein